MMVRVMISRKVPKNAEEKIVGLVGQLRAAASRQPGYVSGETMMNVEDPQEYLVISTWQSLGDWKVWLASGERAKLQKEIDALLGAETNYKTYYYPEKKPRNLDQVQDSGWQAAVQ